MDKKREFICVVCPMGCGLTVEEVDGEYKVSGNACKRGEVYGKQEMVDPRRNISSTVRVRNGFLPLLPVKTGDQIPKNMIFEVMKEINKVEVEAPLKVGDVIIKNVLGTGVDIVAARDIEKK